MGWGPGDMEKLTTIHRAKLDSLISPKYTEKEKRALAFIKAYVQCYMGMNFNDTMESAFMFGIEWVETDGKPKLPY